jgi:catechol 2,3-dioxygenase-like lactoylglutathione lyase family enzyme
MSNQMVHRWYARPVFFVADVNRAIRFYVDMLGFEKSWHEGDGAGTVCQVNHGECVTTWSRSTIPTAMSCFFRFRSERN